MGLATWGCVVVIQLSAEELGDHEAGPAPEPSCCAWRWARSPRYRW